MCIRDRLAEEPENLETQAPRPGHGQALGPTKREIWRPDGHLGPGPQGAAVQAAGLEPCQEPDGTGIGGRERPFRNRRAASAQTNQATQEQAQGGLSSHWEFQASPPPGDPPNSLRSASSFSRR